jgi:hypothetical protein
LQLAKRLFNIDVVPADGQAETWHPDVKFFEVGALERHNPATTGCGMHLSCILRWSCLSQRPHPCRPSSAPPTPPPGAPPGHPSCRALAQVRAANGTTLSYFYLDPYSRPAEKRSGAWMDSVRSRSKLLAPAGARVRLPVALAITNQMGPVGGAPGLMTFREVRRPLAAGMTTAAALFARLDGAPCSSPLVFSPRSPAAWPLACPAPQCCVDSCVTCPAFPPRRARAALPGGDRVP